MKTNNKHLKSKIAVIVIGIFVVLYAIFYGCMCIYMYKDLENPFLLLYGLIPIALLVGIIMVVRMRFKEISKGELDEAKKY